MHRPIIVSLGLKPKLEVPTLRGVVRTMARPTVYSHTKVTRLNSFSFEPLTHQ